MFHIAIQSIVLLVFVANIPAISSHGRLIEPPSRASAWRYGFNTPHNYNDHELYCGGFTRQWVKNEGKCGVCGDPWDSKVPRSHEFGGTFGQGLIVRRYTGGQIVNIRVELTASHFGFFEFSLCSDYKNATQDCLAKNVLQLVKPQEDVDHQATKYFPKDGNKVYEMKYRLPKISCPHCLLQWRYIAGNNWGNCPNGTGAVGCGPQEEFRACADIAIDSKKPPAETTTEDSSLEDNEIHTPEDAKPEASHSPITSVLVSLVSFLAVFLILFLIFFHYYQVGFKIKRWMDEKAFKFGKDKEKAPLPPPRGRKKNVDGLYEVNLQQENLA